MLTRFQEKWDVFSASETGKRLTSAARWVFFAAVAWYLYRELSGIGWKNIVRSLPVQPAFYLLFLAQYISLPVAEILIYKQTWTLPFWGSLPAFLIKRVYNRDLLGYSGEFFFYSWARRNVGQTDGAIARTVRDNNIISSVASTGIAVVLLAIFLGFGEVTLNSLFGRDWLIPTIGVGVVVLLLIPLGIRFRKHLFAMPLGLAASITGIQCARLLAGQVLQIGQWAVVMPEVPLSVWFTFAAVSILISRIPFLPNQNLIFLGAGLQMSAVMNVSTATLAGTLLVTNIVDRVLNLAVLALLNTRADLRDAPESNETETRSS